MITQVFFADYIIRYNQQNIAKSLKSARHAQLADSAENRLVSKRPPHFFFLLTTISEVH